MGFNFQSVKRMLFNYRGGKYERVRSVMKSAHFYIPLRFVYVAIPNLSFSPSTYKATYTIRRGGVLRILSNIYYGTVRYLRLTFPGLFSHVILVRIKVCNLRTYVAISYNFQVYIVGLPILSG